MNRLRQLLAPHEAAEGEERAEEERPLQDEGLVEERELLLDATRRDGVLPDEDDERRQEERRRREEERRPPLASPQEPLQLEEEDGLQLPEAHVAAQAPSPPSMR